jgi:hypothetical protein
MMSIERWLLIAIAVLFYQARCASQGFRIDSSELNKDGLGAYWFQWDSVQDKLITYRNSPTSGGPAARIFRNDGTSIPIYPLIDLPGSWYVNVWSAAATPEGGLTLATVVTYSPPAVKPSQLKSLLLTYDRTGKLTKVWDIDPFLAACLLAVDRDGNVFTLGLSNIDDPYPLIVKYSSTGAVLREFLSSATFPDGDKAIENGSPNGDPGLSIKGSQLFAWIAPSQELFRFSLAGDLLGRTSLAKAINGFAAANGSDHARVQSLTVTDQGEVIAQVQLLPKRATDPVRSLMVRMPADGSSATVLSSGPTTGRFLGITGQGKLVFFEPPSSVKLGDAMISEY